MNGNQAKHKQTGRFLELILLTSLKEEKLYGYRLQDKINEFGFEEDIPSLSTIYRRLNQMEKESLVLSSWAKSSEGPKKKVYQITDKGIKELEIWIERIKKRRKQIDSIIEKHDSLK